MGFNKDFLWGVATAAHQIEGAYNEDGKGPGVWDALVNVPGRVKYSESGNIACNHYHNYKEDIQLMKQMGVKAYRFSISWPRVLPKGVGEVNKKGLQFYSDVVDELLANGIEPLVTLFHWNYPMSLYNQGGWLNESSPEWFEEYVKVVVDRLSDRVKYWITFNEPQMFVLLGHMIGMHAPFLRLSRKEIAQISHNVLLSHGRAVKAIRTYAKQPVKIGFAPQAPCATPEKDTVEAIEQARIKSFACSGVDFAVTNSWWSDPIIFGKYPEDAVEFLGEDMAEIKNGDMELISQPIDFYGANIYSSLAAYGDNSKYAENTFQGCSRTTMDWPVTPESLYWSPKFLYERYKLPILITENGMSNTEWVSLDGKVHDPQRIDFLHRYLREYKRAAQDGIELMGYMCWSFMDNFEWAEGYNKRFGLVYVDFNTQKRTIKDSGYWYKSVIESNGEIL